LADETNSNHMTGYNSQLTESKLPAFTHAQNATDNQSIEEGARAVIQPGQLSSRRERDPKRFQLQI